MWMPKGKSLSPSKMLGKKDPQDNIEDQFIKFAKAQEGVLLRDEEGNERVELAKKPGVLKSSDFSSAEEMKAALGARKSSRNKQ